MNVLCGGSEDPCPIRLNSDCVFYEGAALTLLGINTNDSVQTVIEKINEYLESNGGGGSSTVLWGDITGILTNQTDLISYLNSNYYPLASNPAGYLTSNQSITLTGDVSGVGTTSISVTLATVTAPKGGTGQTSYAVGDLLQADTTSSLAKLAAVATGNVLLSGGVSTVSSWGKVTTSHIDSSITDAFWKTNGTTLLTNDVTIDGSTGGHALDVNAVLLLLSSNSIASLSAQTLIDLSVVSGGITLTADSYLFTGNSTYRVGSAMGTKPTEISMYASSSFTLAGLSHSISYDGTGLSISVGVTNATGDTFYRNSSGYFTRLAIGTAGKLYRSNGTIPTWSTLTMPDTIAALSLFVANSANTLVALTPSAGQSIRMNAGGTAWEAYTPGSSGWQLTGTSTLTGATIIDNDVYALTIGNDNANIRFLTANGNLLIGNEVSASFADYNELQFGTNAATALLRTVTNATTDNFGIYLDTTGTSIYYNNTTSNQITGTYSAITLTSSVMSVVDGLNTTGLVYAADYSANFTARSIVDKGYADANLLGLPLASPTGSEIGQSIRWNAGGTAWEYYTPDGGAALSSITAATGTNTIDNASYAQEWQWNTLGANTGLLLSSSATDAASNTQTVFRVNQTGANASATQTTYSVYVSNTKTGTSSTNVAAYFAASGGTTNYALDVNGDWRLSDNDNSNFYTIARGALTVNRTLTWPSMANNGYIAAINTVSAGFTRVLYGANSLGSVEASANFTFTSGTNTLATTNATLSNSLVVGGTTITSGSVLADFQSTTLGVLMPRVTNIASVATPVKGMIAYDATTDLFNHYEGSSAAWHNPVYLTKTQTLTNKTLTSPQINFGTNANYDLITRIGGVTSRIAMGTALQVLRVNAGATALEYATISGTGDVVGPASATDNALVAFDTTTGKLVKNSDLIYSSGVLSRTGSLVVFGSGANTFGSASQFNNIVGHVRINSEVSSSSPNPSYIAGQQGTAAGDAADVHVHGGKLAGGTSGNAGHAYIYGGANLGSGLEGNVAFNTDAVSNWQGMERGAFIQNVTTEPSAAIADGIAVYSKDSSDGSANSTLGLYLEQAVEAIGTFTPSHKLKIWINGVEYWIQLDAV